jgi:glutathione S-transferase
MHSVSALILIYEHLRTAYYVIQRQRPNATNRMTIMNTEKYTLISHHLCPYAQRAAIALFENNVAYERKNIDLGNKPDWFLKLSPLGKVPLLVVNDETVVFESSVIAEYINDTNGGELLSTNALNRASQRAWVEFASQMIANIGQYYTAADEETLEVAATQLAKKWQTLENRLGNGPWFEGDEFSLVDAAFAPVFRFFETFEQLTGIEYFATVPKVSAWRRVLASRPSVRKAVAEDFSERLLQFFAAKESVIGKLASHKLSALALKAA